MIPAAKAGVAALVPILALASIASEPARGQVATVRGEAGASSRLFPEQPRFPEQQPSSVSPSLTLTLEGGIEPEDGDWWLAAEGFARVDAHDENRTHFDARELGMGYLGDGYTVYAGIGQVFWGVTEVRHLVDVVNQIDAVEDLDGEDKLGQPMMSLTLEGSWGAVDLFYLPYFREREFPAADARLRGPLPVGETASYGSDRGRWHPGFAVRAFRTFGALDVGVSGFRGISREPRFELDTDAEGSPSLRPLYDLIDQIGLDVQWTGASTLLKLEAITRGGHGGRFYALAGGFEHTTYQVLGTNGDLGLLGEIMVDGRGATAPPTTFDHDLFLGARWARNDVADSSVLGGPVVDLRTGEVLFLAEGSKRIGSGWRLEVDVRLFANAEAGSLVHGIGNDGYLGLALARFF
jgi:hypothetical protein